ncbi:MAG: MaoC family dehydratase N-terminal domain-containing protein [Chloroflexi bacterium]|nr:MaoC family dehydratase N-terminal domain-containing protein [Chloroflexota bacterium]
MVNVSSDIDRLRSNIGVEWEPVVYKIEKGMIRRFVQAIDDPNPLWQNEEYARKSRYGGIVAPPTFILTIGFEEIQQQILASIPSGTILHGDTTLECYQPIKPGDVITATTKITNIRQRQGEKGKTAFISFEITYMNQKQEPVANCRQMVVSY